MALGTELKSIFSLVLALLPSVKNSSTTLGAEGAGTGSFNIVIFLTGSADPSSINANFPEL